MVEAIHSKRCMLNRLPVVYQVIVLELYIPVTSVASVVILN